MLSAEAAEVATSELVSGDFHVTANKRIFDSVVSLVSNGLKVEPETVALDLERRQMLSAAGGSHYLVDLMGHVGSTTAISAYTREVADCAARRRTVGHSEDIGRKCKDRRIPLEDVIRQVDEMRADIDLPTVGGSPDADIETFLSGETTYEWLVPGLLELGDRLILTGAEGGGKSTLLRQLAVTVAAGLHPFTLDKIPPARVLLIDLENGEAHVRRRIRPLALKATQMGMPITKENLRVRVKSDGIDLLARSDVRWLYDRIAANLPNLLLIGPVYKLYTGNPADEEPARAAAKVLDTIRTRWGVTLVMEAHSPHGDGSSSRDLRPFGASLWKRWPEFGLGIAPDPDDPIHFAKLNHWRGPRDERDWPKRLRRGGSWPWTAVED